MSKRRNKTAAASGLESLVRQITALATQVAGLSAQVELLEKQSAPAELLGLKRTMAALVEKFDAMQSVTEAAVMERERERQSLIAELAGHYRVAFSADELDTMPIDMLRKLRDTAKGESYVGRSGPHTSLSERVVAVLGRKRNRRRT